MPTVSACPGPAELERLMMGQLTGQAAEELAQHLEQCAQCTHVVAALETDDALVWAARAPVTTSVEGAALAKLYERLDRLGPRAGGGAHGGGAVPAAATEGHSFPFLAPAQQ